MLRTGKGFVTI